MAQFVNGVESEEKTVNLQVEAIVKDGEIVEVKQSGQLGTQKLAKNEDEDVWECVGVYGRPKSKVEVSFDVFDLGTVSDKKVVSAEGTEDSVKFDALEFLDEPEAKNGLNGEELAKLRNTSVGELRLEARGNGSAAFKAAVTAILQHEDGSTYDLNGTHLPAVVKNDKKDTVKGDHADDTDVLLVIGDHELDTQSKYWKFCTYGPCQGGERYAFTWENVPLSFLDEPK